jgi:CHAD domain-containing protein
VTKRLAAYLERQAVALQEGERVLRSGDAVSTHATRVAIRRYRSVLHAFPDSFPHGRARRLNRRLKWYAGVLGEVRDRQVLRSFFSDVLDEWPDPAATLRLRPVLIGRLDEEVAEHWAVLQHELDRKRYRSMVSDVAALRVASVSEDELVDAMHAAAEGFAERFAEAEADDGDVELFHDARKAAKRARYVAGVVGTKPARELALRFARMQEVLGDHQDHVVASAYVQRLIAEGPVAADLEALRRHFVRAAAALRRQAIGEAHALGLLAGRR